VKDNYHKGTMYSIESRLLWLKPVAFIDRACQFRVLSLSSENHSGTDMMEEYAD